MLSEEMYNKIIAKKEFSQLPKKDVELAFEKFDKERYVDEEKVKLTRDLLRKVFSAFTSSKILSPKNKDEEWILKKHISTRERFSHYNEVYGRIFGNSKKFGSVIDLGAGVNGFSYNFFENKKIKYVAVEAVGQLTEIMNLYFKRNKINGEAIHESLFELDKIKEILKEQKKPRVVFLFKVVDSLEMLERNYSKKFLEGISKYSEKIVLSFATRSLVKGKKFFANRNWILNFLKENFNVVDDFEIGNEKYIVVEK